MVVSGMSLLFLTSLLAVTCCGCGDGDGCRPEGEPLRLLLKGGFGPTVSVWIVGNGQDCRLKQLQVTGATVTSPSGVVLPLQVEMHGGDVSKYGPYAALEFDATGWKGDIEISADVLYQGRKYHCRALFAEDVRSGERFWVQKAMALARVE